ncbi:alpha/beta hydrolase [Kribbella shirazensis]|uniref:Pimeloyl-ACP methyl ester carboxylesterase n=1 Tax=Kribbella shirazensis TaxID=1105143 RepID=A0A7X5V8Y6_9ACTN|nr:alpha/beta hydrolase [Kribbella shirazensis]NIK56579.1 pimeloyl-ACP methyl ester carboxylesterase [Kribbella shirazensis]
MLNVGRSAVIFVVLTFGSAGCGSGSDPATPPPSSSTASVPPPSSPASSAPAGIMAGCPSEGAKAFIAPVAGGTEVSGVHMGSAKRAVVLSYEWGGSPCDWSGVATELVARGYRVALWEYGTLTGLDRVKELQAVVDQVRAAGATEVVLAGGSVGGCVSMIGGTMIKPAVSGVAVLSCASWYDVEHRMPTTPLAAKLRVPTLYLAGDRDRLPVADVRKDFAAVPAKDKKLVVVPDSTAHGVDLLDGTEGAVAKSALFAFLDRITR